ncbi:MAG TPA: hypothetical protein VJR89_13875, partial [Polyangiales bacterium]|nr:hypothetical protein [Polyangiales bacterium]
WTLAACSGSEPPAAAEHLTGSEAPTQPAAGSPPSAKAEEPDLAAHMQASFWMAVRARDALIAGDLAAAQRAGDALAAQDYMHLVPADWKHWVVSMQHYARELSMAPNPAAAGQELGRLALVCGDCHDLHQRGPERVRPEPEPWRDPPEELEARMLRHQIGAEQLWEGLVLPSETSFRSGITTLTRAPLRAPERRGEPIDEAMNARIEKVRALAKAARAATTYEARGQVYGELIATCADCHAFARPAP